MSEKTKKIRDNNQIHKRLRFIRKHLKLTVAKIEKQTGIPASTYTYIENGARTIIYEYYLVLAAYFNAKNEGKTFTYLGKKMSSVPCDWIMFGDCTTSDLINSRVEEVRDYFSIRELELLERQFELENVIRSIHGRESKESGLQRSI